MGLIKGILLGLLIAIAISACGSLPRFLYKFYIYNYEQGLLQGPKPSDDLSADVCSFSNGEYQCVVMKIDEFYRLKSDYQKGALRIQELERNCGRDN